MDNHPIPQDVTGFQFRLIGDMTVKQFAYVAVGGIFAVVFLYAPIPFLLRIPFMIFFGALGATIAFVPFEGRPIDLMLGYFLKALVTPNQYAYHKTGGRLAIFDYQTQKQTSPTQVAPVKKSVSTQTAKEKERKLNSYLSTHHTKTISALDQKEDQFLTRLFTGTDPSQAPQQVQAPTPPVQAMQQPEPQTQLQQVPMQTAPPLPPAPAPEPAQEVKEPLTETQLQEELGKAHLEEDHEQNPEKKALAHTHVAELSAQLEEVQAQKEKLEKELAELRAQAEEAKNESVVAVEPAPAPPQSIAAESLPQPAPEPQIEAKIRKVPTEAAKAVGLPYVPEAPNLILGIVKDSRGNALSNILVEVKDKNGNPARAFRTNALGQFASATQLNDGVYTIEFEDPKGEHKFDSVEIDARGEIIMPFEVISHDDREELRKALFN